MFKIGVVLSGGGAKGFTHLGVLQALLEMNIKINAISGVSSGAIVGAFIAAGYKPYETLEIIRENKLSHYFKFIWKGLGLLDMRKLNHLLLRYFPEDSFESLKIPLYITATDLIKCETICFSHGSLINPILGSSAIPVIFNPIKFQEMLLLDGGVLNNLPVEPLIGKCNKIIGVHVNYISPEFKYQSKMRILERSFHLAIANTVLTRSKMCDVFIEPPEMTNFSMFHVSKSIEMFEIGYKHTLKMKEEILSQLK